jgi:hypothetical protein
MTSTRNRPPRAYLLLEVALGGAIVAVIVGSILTSLSQARTMSIISGRDQTASQLVLETLDERRALGFALVTAQAAAPVTGVHGVYTRETTVTPCVEVIAAPGANMNCKDITVTVTYPISANASTGNATTRTSRATVRVYP